MLNCWGRNVQRHRIISRAGSRRINLGRRRPPSLGSGCGTASATPKSKDADGGEVNAEDSVRDTTGEEDDTPTDPEDDPDSDATLDTDASGGSASDRVRGVLPDGGT